MNLDDYDYFLPKKNLALEPSVPRDSSKLLIYDTTVDKIIFDHFYNLDKYLPKDSFMVLNNTKVLPARVTMKKENGGKIIILFLVNELGGPEVDQRSLQGGYIKRVKALADRKVNIGEYLFFDQENFLTVIGQKEHIFELEFNFSREHLFALLKKYGTMPIPPYLKKSSLTKNQLLNKYQTIFARAPDGARHSQASNGTWLASVAAPTASLHFTDEVFKKLDKKDIRRLFVTLHVGLGTFAPITNENIKLKKLHEEYYEVEEKTIQCIETLKQEGKKLVAVGTTVVRTLESIKKLTDHELRIFEGRGKHDFFTFEGTPTKSEVRLSCDKNYVTEPIINKADLFIFPPYDFKMVDALITNFHLPKSSLTMLVEAFLQYRAAKKNLVDLYNIAIKNNFRFYSFGDAMLIV